MSPPLSYPTDFTDAVNRVLEDEGSYVNNSSDPGGETKFGISKRDHPGLDIQKLTRDQAIEIFYREWWLRFRFSELRSDLSAKVFNIAILVGAKEAIEFLQRAVRAYGLHIAEDGMLGHGTLAAVNTCSNPQAILAAFRSEAAGYFRQLAALEGRDEQFLTGWLNRAYE